MPPERRKKYGKEAHTFSVRRACALFLSLGEQKMISARIPTESERRRGYNREKPGGRPEKCMQHGTLKYRDVYGGGA